MRGRFGIESVFWRRLIDRSVAHIPAIFHRPLIWIAAFLFFFVAGSARKALLRNFRLIRPRSFRLFNYPRVVRVFANFGWSLTDAAAYRLLRVPVQYEVEGEDFLRELAWARGAIVLTAHMGNYDLGAAFFAQKFQRRIQMVRAPEADTAAAEHVDRALQASTGGAVEVGYSSDGTALAFDLLNALRQGQIISIQGDRVTGEIGRARARLFGQEVLLPSGPFYLALASGALVYPIFVVRTGYRKYKIIGYQPIACARDSASSRDQAVNEALDRWGKVLEQTVRASWPQWFAFTPIL
jgi:phosphatidylinositol dimannoside acyltransferase